MDTIWKNQIIKAYKEGKSLQEIANKYKVTKETIRQRLIRWQQPIRSHSELKTITSKKIEYLKEKIIYDYMRNGLSMTRIAGRYNINYKTLAEKIKDWGYYDESRPNRRKNYFYNYAK